MPLFITDVQLIDDPQQLSREWERDTTNLGGKGQPSAYLAWCRDPNKQDTPVTSVSLSRSADKTKLERLPRNPAIPAEGGRSLYVELGREQGPGIVGLRALSHAITNPFYTLAEVDGEPGVIAVDSHRRYVLGFLSRVEGQHFFTITDVSVDADNEPFWLTCEDAKLVPADPPEVLGLSANRPHSLDLTLPIVGPGTKVGLNGSHGNSVEITVTGTTPNVVTSGKWTAYLDIDTSATGENSVASENDDAVG